MNKTLFLFLSAYFLAAPLEGAPQNHYLYYDPSSLKAQRVLEFCQRNDLPLVYCSFGEKKAEFFQSITSDWEQKQSAPEDLYERFSLDLEAFEKEEGVVLSFEELKKGESFSKEKVIVGADSIISFLTCEWLSSEPEYFDSE